MVHGFSKSGLGQQVPEAAPTASTLEAIFAGEAVHLVAPVRAVTATITLIVAVDALSTSAPKLDKRIHD